MHPFVSHPLSFCPMLYSKMLHCAGKSPVTKLLHVKDVLVLFCIHGCVLRQKSTTHKLIVGLIPNARQPEIYLTKERGFTKQNVSAVQALHILLSICISTRYYSWREVTSFLTPGHPSKVLTAICIQRHWHLGPAIPEQTLQRQSWRLLGTISSLIPVHTLTSVNETITDTLSWSFCGRAEMQ